MKVSCNCEDVYSSITIQDEYISLNEGKKVVYAFKYSVQQIIFENEIQLDVPNPLEITQISHCDP